jgi:hypothetical protein
MTVISQRCRGRRLPFICILTMSMTLAVAATPQENSEEPGSVPDPFEMELEQFLRIELKSAAGLTKMDSRRAPVALLELDTRDVEQSGARSLNQLLELSVPNCQLIDHHHHLPHLGLRGIISDREDKYLYQVNGRTMNNRMGTGADNERGIPLLGDVRAVSVVRGPASATHGAGALAGVINVETYNGLTFQGADLNLRQGFVEQFSAAEARYGKQLGDESGIFLYYGLADQTGADGDSAHYYMGQSYPAINGLPENEAGKPLGASMANLGAPAFDALHHKVHVSSVQGPFEIWIRFVQDGYEDRPMREIYRTEKPDHVSVAKWTSGRAFLNRQLTLAGTYKKELSDQWSVNLMQSYDRYWFREVRMGTQTTAPDPRNGEERELFSRAIAVWSPRDAHSLAFGAEYSREAFVDPYFSDALDREPMVEKREWSTDTISFLTEYQWKINSRWILFMSARTDKHTYSDWLFAPRGTLVFTPTGRDTLKAMCGRSVRRGGDSELWAQHVRDGSIPKPESLLSFELTYERKLGGKWTLGGNAFYEDYDAIGWVPVALVSRSIGKYTIAGGEIQIAWNAAKTHFILSQGMTKLVAASVPQTLPAGGQGITSEPYGYGNDLANWAPFLTKLTLRQDVGKKWSAIASLIHYSGFPGGKDYSRYAATLASPPPAMPLSDPGYDEPYGPNLFVNLGLEYRASEHLTCRIDGYNMADLADEKLSKRNYYFRLSEFSEQPASLSASLRYRFW